MNENRVDGDTLELVKRNQNKFLWINAILPILIFGILGSIILDSFWAGVGSGILIWTIVSTVNFFSGLISYRLLGGKQTQIDSLYIIVKDADLPIPNKYSIEMPEEFYRELLEDVNLPHRLTIVLTVLSTGIELARNQGAFVRLMRLTACHKLALEKYRKYRVSNRRVEDTFINCPECNEAIDKDSNYCIYCSKEIL